MFTDLKILLMLRRLRRAAAPRSDFRRALALRLEAERFLHGHRPRFFALFAPRSLAVPLAVVVLLAASGTGAYAYAGDAVTAGHPLYPVKQALEAAEVALAPTQSLQVAVRLRHAERRMRELQRLVDRQKIDPGPTLEQADAELDAGMEEAAAARPEVRARAIEAARREDDAAAVRLERLLREEPATASQVIVAHLKKNVSELRSRAAVQTDPERRRMLEQRIERRSRMLERAGETEQEPAD